ncbi:hypothetical protein SDC9_152403 [bioreactor metagenome]|uniref:Uncharacterized protein n=1 Tax=bioreactor metagenome TaxID=1076179 RepID=A0A645EXD1_9ZZZZ
MIRLAAAAHAAAGAGHNLDGIIRFLAGTDGFQHAPGIAQSMGHADGEILAANIYLSFPDLPKAPELGKLHFFQRLVGQPLVSRP